LGQIVLHKYMRLRIIYETNLINVIIPCMWLKKKETIRETTGWCRGFRPQTTITVEPVYFTRDHWHNIVL